MTELSDDKWVRVMADFSAAGLWNRNGAAVGAEELPVPDDITARLCAWQEWYERDCQDYLPIMERERHLDQPAFTEEGRQIAKAIKAALPGWTVVYFDEIDGADSVISGNSK